MRRSFSCLCMLVFLMAALLPASALAAAVIESQPDAVSSQNGQLQIRTSASLLSHVGQTVMVSFDAVGDREMDVTVSPSSESSANISAVYACPVYADGTHHYYFYAQIVDFTNGADPDAGSVPSVISFVSDRGGSFEISNFRIDLPDGGSVPGQNLMPGAERVRTSAQGKIEYEVGDALASYINQNVSVSFEIRSADSRRVTLSAKNGEGVSISFPPQYKAEIPTSDSFERRYFSTSVVDYGTSASLESGALLFDDGTGSDGGFEIRNLKIEVGQEKYFWSPAVTTARAGVQTLRSYTQTRRWNGMSMTIVGAQPSQTMPWGYRAGLIEDDELGECLLLTPNTSARLSSFGTAEQITVIARLHPQALAGSEGVTLAVQAADASGAILREEELFLPSSGQQVSLTLNRDDLPGDAALSIYCLENQESGGSDWAEVLVMPDNYVPEAPCDAMIVGHDTPSTLFAGQEVSYNVRVRNTGERAWTAGEGFALAVFVNGEDVGHRVALPAGSQINAGVNFNFTIDSLPLEDTIGLVTLVYQMVDNYGQPFGDSASADVLVKEAGNDAEFISVTAASTASGGTINAFKAVVRNTGSGDWNGAENYRLAVYLNGEAAQYIDVTQFMQIKQGGQYEFTVPALSLNHWSGDIALTLQMEQNAVPFGSGYQTTVYAQPQILDAKIISHTLPSTASNGELAPFAVTVRNTGNNAWSSASGIGLVITVEGEAGNRFAAISGDKNVKSGDDCVFQVAAIPLSRGNEDIDIRFQMATADGQLFGEEYTASFFAEPLPLDAAIVSHTTPSATTNGAVTPFTVTVRNDGSTAWSEQNGIRLVALINGEDVAENHFSLPAGQTIWSGEEYTFQIEQLSLNHLVGDITVEYSMAQEDARFGESVTAEVHADAPELDAQIVPLNELESYTVGEKVSFRIRTVNTGTKTWSKDDNFHLVISVDGETAFQVEMARSKEVKTGEEYVFQSPPFVPNTPQSGSVTFSYQMMQGDTPFGENVTQQVPIVQ